MAALSLETLRRQVLTSMYGRRAGLSNDEFFVGVKDIKQTIEEISTTVPTTVLAYGMTRITVTGSSQGPVQHNLPAPIPGVEKILALGTTSTGSHQFLSTPNGASVLCGSDGTTKSLVNLVGQGGVVKLIGVSTAIWQVLHQVSTGGVSYTTST